MSISSFINNLALQKQVYSITDANVADIPLPNGTNNNIALVRLVGVATEAGLSLPAGLYSIKFRINLLVAAGGATNRPKLQNLLVLLVDGALGTLLAGSNYNLIADVPLTATTYKYTGTAVVDLPVATTIFLRADVVNPIYAAGDTFVPNVEGANSTFSAQPIFLY